MARFTPFFNEESLHDKYGESSDKPSQGTPSQGTPSQGNPSQGELLIDIETIIKKRPTRMLGSTGAAREEALLIPLQDRMQGSYLPVLLGSGLGHALTMLLAQTTGPIAVVDKETDLLAITALREKFSDSRIFWVTCNATTSSQEIVKILTKWQMQHDEKPFAILTHPFYQRLDTWYAEIRTCLNNATPQPTVWENVQQPRFVKPKPRLLLITSKYFLLGELLAACKLCDFEYEIMELKGNTHEVKNFMLALLQKVTSFKPDCLITMNHLAIDIEGVMVDMLARMRIPMASWFLDNPHLILEGYRSAQSPWLALFTWDIDNIASLKEAGHEHVFYLPLGTDPQRFVPNPKKGPLYKAVSRDVTFVGNSMVYKVANRLEKGNFKGVLLRQYKTIAKAFGASQERSVRTFLRQYNQEIAKAFDALDSPEDYLVYEALLTWEATCQYREACAKALLEFNPLFIGDPGWHISLKNVKEAWEYKPPVAYYDELPRVYPFSTINFNCTSKQMKGAVNQRIFDVPAAGSFVLSDWREQMDALLEPNKEIIVYNEIEEIPELVRFYLKNAPARKAIVDAGRKRVLAEHTWAHRLRALVAQMKEIYGH